jgi:GNAT superfamily N-acetyltransferase
MIKQGMFSKTWTLINPDMMTFNPDKIQLVSIEDFKNDNPMGVTNFLANIEEYYAVGDEYMIADILYKFDHIEYEDDIAEIREAFDLWVIMYDGMYLGIIGVENFIGDPSQDIKWLSWTLSLKEFRSKGIGGKALELLTNTLKKAGIVRLYVDSDLAPGTIRFYEKAGFTKLGTCKKFRKENPLYTKDFLLYDQDIVMYKDLV